MHKGIKYVHLTKRQLDELFKDYFIISQQEYNAIQELEKRPIKTNLAEYLDRISKFSKNPERFKRKFLNPREVSAATSKDLADCTFVVSDRFQFNEEKQLAKVSEKELETYFLNIQLVAKRKFNLIPKKNNFHLLTDMRGVVVKENGVDYHYTDLRGFASLRVKKVPQRIQSESTNSILLLIRVAEDPIGFAYIGKHIDTYRQKPEWFNWIMPQLNKEKESTDDTESK